MKHILTVAGSILVLGALFLLTFAGGLRTTSLDAYEYSWSLDTISNTANDTLTISDIQNSNWQYNFTAACTEISGTTDLIFILQESNETSGTNWYELERDTIGATGISRLHGSSNSDGIGHVKGRRLRIIVDGDAGATQSTSYNADLTLKK